MASGAMKGRAPAPSAHPEPACGDPCVTCPCQSVYIPLNFKQGGPLWLGHVSLMLSLLDPGGVVSILFLLERGCVRAKSLSPFPKGQKP